MPTELPSHFASIVVGVVALVFGLGVFWKGDECTDRLGKPAIVAMVVVLSATSALAVVIWVVKKATLRRSNIGAYLLALVGLVELVKFAAVPSGTPVLGGAPGWTLIVVAIGFTAVAFLGAINPLLAESFVGGGVAIAGGYLLLYDVRIGGIVDDCRRFGRAGFVVLPVVVISLLLGRK